MKVLCILFSKPVPEIEKLALSFKRHSSRFVVRGKEAILIEVEDSGSPRAVESIQLRARLYIEKWGLDAYTALASDAPTALAFARYGKSRKGELPLLALLDYAMPFQITEKKSRGMGRKIQILQQLGIRNLGQFLAFPEKALVECLGKEMLSLYGAVRDSRGLSWPCHSADQDRTAAERDAMILRITAKLNEAPFHLAGTDAKREPELAWLKVLQNYIVEATAYKAFPKDLLGRG